MHAVLLLALAGSIFALPREIQERGSSAWLPRPEESIFAPSHKTKGIEDVPKLDYALIRQIFGPPPVGESENFPQSHADDDVILVRGEAGKVGSAVEKDESDSECVPYYICKNGVIVTDGTGIIDIRAGIPQNKVTQCTNNADCTRLYEICCRKPTTNHGVDDTTNNDLTYNEDGANRQPATTESSKRVDGADNGVIKPTIGTDEDEIEATTEPFSPTKVSSCACVPYFLCNDGVINTDGTGLLDVRLGKSKDPNEEERPACFDPMYVCCNVPTTVPTIQTETTGEIPTGEHSYVTEIPEDGSNANSTEDTSSEMNDTMGGQSPTVKPKDPLGESSTSCIHHDDPSNTYGVGLIDIRMKSDGNLSDDAEISGQNVTMDEEVIRNCSFTPEKCCPEVTPEPSPTAPSFQPLCGRSNHLSARIINVGADDEAEYLEFPWMVAILRQQKISNGTDFHDIYLYQCGGSLIHNQVVLTAAHCVVGKDTSRLYVRLGEYDTQKTTETFPHEDVRVTRIEVHEAYYSGALFNDVVLLFLEREVDLGPNIDTVCLPVAEENFDHAFHCLASGWGKDKFGKEGMYQNVLKKVELSIVPHDVCQRQLRATRLGRWFRLHPSFTCAGGELGKDTCKGDGGGPLVCPVSVNPPRYAQVGIVAWGIGCGENGIPGVYVDVAKFVPWIQEKIKEVPGAVISTYDPSAVESTGTVTPQASVETALVTPTAPGAATTAAYMAIAEPFDVEQDEDEIHLELFRGDDQKKQKNKHKARKERKHRWRKEKKEEREKQKKARKEERKESKRERRERRKERRKHRQQRWK